ncbi:MAG: SPFH domain-containing protein [Phycisphaerales bacterium]
MAGILLAIGVVLSIFILSMVPKAPNTAARAGLGIVALAVLLVFVSVSSVRFVGENEVGVVVKNYGPDLPPGNIIARNGEKGPQADILGPGWHFFLWPGLYDVEISPIIEITEGEVGLLTASDGQPLPAGESFAPEWTADQMSSMLNDGNYFVENGFKGPQSTVLKPGKHRFNPKLFAVDRVPVTNIEKATVAVIKSNVGTPPEGVAAGAESLVPRGQRGIWLEPYTPQKLYLNTKAYEVTVVSTRKSTVRYGIGGTGDETEIEVRTSDGFTFPVDVRVEYRIKPEDASLVVAEFGDDKETLRLRLASAVRAIFRNNAENVKALDYVKQRSQQESSTTSTLASAMKEVGVTIEAVRIGEIGDEQSLGALLKTQTEREIAIQEQITLEEQQRAAEKKKDLSRTEQEAEEERRLATASYGVQIAEQDKEKRIIEANAEAEAIRIQAEAQAEAFRVIAEQIGAGNTALVELLKIVGERGINITPRVMVVGGQGANGERVAEDAQTTALIGTMLDTMIDRSPQPETVASQQQP